MDDLKQNLLTAISQAVEQVMEQHNQKESAEKGMFESIDSQQKARGNKHVIAKKFFDMLGIEE